MTPISTISTANGVATHSYLRRVFRRIRGSLRPNQCCIEPVGSELCARLRTQFTDARFAKGPQTEHRFAIISRSVAALPGALRPASTFVGCVLTTLKYGWRPT